MTELRIVRWGGYPEISGWPLNAITNVLMREAEWDYTETHREEKTLWPQRQTGAMWPPAKESWWPPETERNLHRFSSAFGGCVTLANTLTLALWHWFQTSDYQNCERINLCYCKLPKKPMRWDEWVLPRVFLILLHSVLLFMAISEAKAE